MAFRIEDFKARGLTYGGARPSLFQIGLTLPNGVINAGTVETINKLTFTARASSIPESTIEAIQVPYFGRKIKIAGDRTFADWRVTVMNDEDYSVRAMFEKWSNLLNTHVTNLRIKDTYNEDYKADMDVIQFSKAGEIIRQYRIVGGFPTTVDAMELDWDTTNQVQTFNVTFAYDYWVPVTNNTNAYTGDETNGGTPF